MSFMRGTFTTDHWRNYRTRITSITIRSATSLTPTKHQAGLKRKSSRFTWRISRRCHVLLKRRVASCSRRLTRSKISWETTHQIQSRKCRMMMIRLVICSLTGFRLSLSPKPWPLRRRTQAYSSTFVRKTIKPRRPISWACLTTIERFTLTILKSNHRSAGMMA